MRTKQRSTARYLPGRTNQVRAEGYIQISPLFYLFSAKCHQTRSGITRLHQALLLRDRSHVWARHRSRKLAPVE